jgi:DNA invertase Pin-like site-specific DNA recombinase
MPNANRLTVGIMAMVAEEERRMISKRTKDALAAAKKRGTKLGGDRGVVPSKKTRAMGVQALQARADAKAADLAPIIEELRATGKTSLRAIASGLNDAGIPSARGGKWSSPQVMRMLERLDPFREEEEAAAA